MTWYDEIEEPSTAELAAIEAEAELLAAELALLDAEADFFASRCPRTAAKFLLVLLAVVDLDPTVEVDADEFAVLVQLAFEGVAA